MKLRTRIFFSYFTVIVLTLAFLGWLIDSQIQRHVNDFYQAIQINGVEIITGPHNAPPPREDFLKLLDHSIFLTALSAGLFAFLFSLAVTAHVTRPIQNVIRATRDIAQGNYKKRLTPKT
jgi:hypothetical protein